MKVLVTGRHVGVTESMKAYAQAKMEKLLKFYERATAARVTMDVDHDEHIVEMVLDVTRGITLVGKASSPDMYAACDLAEQKLGKRLRRWKSRLVDHHRGERPPSAPADLGAPAREDDEPTYEDVVERLARGEEP